MSHSTWYLSLRWQEFLTELKPYFPLNESTLLLFELSIQTLATSPNWYAAGIPGSTANSSYLVKGIRAALYFSQECGMAELLTKSDRLDIQSLCSRVMPPTSGVHPSTKNSIRITEPVDIPARQRPTDLFVTDRWCLMPMQKATFPRRDETGPAVH